MKDNTTATMIIIKITPTADLHTYLKHLQDQSRRGQSQQAATANRIKILAIELTLAEREGAAA